MNAIKITLAASLLSIAGQASSATIIQDVSFLYDGRGFFGSPSEKPGSLNLFDPTIGTLKSVSVDIDVEAMIGFLFTTSVPVTFVTSGQVVLTGSSGPLCCALNPPLSIPRVTLDPATRQISGGTFSQFFQPRAFGSASATYSDNLDVYTGTSKVWIAVNPATTVQTAVYDMNGNFIRNRSSTASARGVATFTYTYEAINAAVPEPATWAMMILGFGLAGWALRMRRLPRDVRLVNPG